ncbi:hypothetical protein C8Q77DRAFT_262384 [Trametes polyzona]|nr:hypothetical protein C8Q77DRAFT_262384 [Trametes polyzona]
MRYRRNPDVVATTLRGCLFARSPPDASARGSSASRVACNASRDVPMGSRRCDSGVRRWLSPSRGQAGERLMGMCVVWTLSRTRGRGGGEGKKSPITSGVRMTFLGGASGGNVADGRVPGMSRRAGGDRGRGRCGRRRGRGSWRCWRRAGPRGKRGCENDLPDWGREGELLGGQRADRIDQRLGQSQRRPPPAPPPSPRKQRLRVGPRPARIALESPTASDTQISPGTIEAFTADRPWLRQSSPHPPHQHPFSSPLSLRLRNPPGALYRYTLLRKSLPFQAAAPGLTALFLNLIQPLPRASPTRTLLVTTPTRTRSTTSCGTTSDSFLPIQTSSWMDINPCLPSPPRATCPPISPSRVPLPPRSRTWPRSVVRCRPSSCRHSCPSQRLLPRLSRRRQRGLARTPSPRQATCLP